MTAALKNLACIVNYFLKIFRPKFQHNTIFACEMRLGKFGLFSVPVCDDRFYPIFFKRSEEKNGFPPLAGV